MSQPKEPAGERYTLFSSDTLEGLRAAREEARRTSGADGGAALRACELAVAAVTASDAGRTDEARHFLREALAATNDSRLLYLGFQFFFRLSAYDEAERLVRRRLEVVGAETADAARAWNNYGLILHFRGDEEGAETMMRRALEIDRRIGHEEGVARDLGNLSLIPEARGDLDAAERLNREALAIAERIGFMPVVASRLCNLGEIALARGKKEEARGLLVRAEAVFCELGVEKSRVHCERLIAGLGGAG